MSISAKRSLKGSMTSKSELNGGMNIGVVQAHEVDPTVPDWAKQPEKPTYTAEEVGAQPVGDYALKSDIPEVPVQSINGKTGAVELNASDVGALPEDTVIPVVDDTLTVEGAAADSKATGEYITLVQNSVTNQSKYFEKRYAKKTEIPNVPETTESDMYLITDNEGNRTWAKQLAYVRKEEVPLVAETEVAASGTTSLTQLIAIETGATVYVTFNGITYESTAVDNSGVHRVTVDGKFMFMFVGMGYTAFVRNDTGETGLLSVTMLTDKYYTLDPKFMPIKSEPGSGPYSIMLTPYDGVSLADGIYSVSANYGKSTGVASFSINDGTANGTQSFASGSNTIANGYAQYVGGKYNIEDELGVNSKYAHIIGNGSNNPSTGEVTRSNAHTVSWDGTGWFANGLKVGGTGQDDEAAVDVALKSEIIQLSEEIVDQGKAIEGKQPKGDYALKSEIPTVDNTLSVAGAAAESLVVKNQLDSTKNVLLMLLNQKQPKGDYALKSDIPEVPETTESDMYLVTDNEGNRTWAKQLAYVRQEEQVLIAETEITDTSTNAQPELIIQLIPIKNGDIVKVTFNGTVYEAAALTMGTRYRVVIPSVCSFILTGVGRSTQFYNLSGQTGVISATAITDKYYTIDPNFLPTASKAGTAYCSVILTPYSLAKADGSYSVSANYAAATNNAAFAANMGNANGMYSFATGRDTKANGIYSRADGFSTIANGDTQHAEGKYNIEDTEEKYAHIIGNGDYDTETNQEVRSNAHTVDWDGNGWFAGTLKIGGTGQDDEAAQEVALKSDLPAPEGMWEEIEVFELSESTQGPINRSMDLDGAPYNFKRLRIEMTLSKGNVGTISVLVGLSDKTNKIIVHLPDAMSEEETLCNNLCLDIRNGALEITGIIGAPNTSVLTGQVAYPTLYTTNGVITDITIGATAAMGADSLFRIKAVRA